MNSPCSPSLLVPIVHYNELTSQSYIHSPSSCYFYLSHSGFFISISIGRALHHPISMARFINVKFTNMANMEVKGRGGGKQGEGTRCMSESCNHNIIRNRARAQTSCFYNKFFQMLATSTQLSSVCAPKRFFFYSYLSFEPHSDGLLLRRTGARVAFFPE